MAARSKRAAILFRKWRFARPRAFGRLTGPAPPRGTSRRPPPSRLPRAGVKEAPPPKLRLVVIPHHDHPVQAGQADGVMGKKDRKSVVSGKIDAVRVHPGGRRNIKKKKA